jgi:hypothetical protein
LPCPVFIFGRTMVHVRRVANPQRTRPPVTAIEKALAGRDVELKKLYLKIHALVLKTLPGVSYTIDTKDGMMGYGAHQYGADGWGIAALACHSRWVSLGFVHGAELPDPTRILEGSGKNVRHVKIRSEADLKERWSAVRALILAAAER